MIPARERPAGSAALLPVVRRDLPVDRVRTDPLLKADPAAMQGLASRCLKVGRGGVAAVGVVSLCHGDGATTIARSLAGCLAGSFGKRVVLVEANLRSPCLRETLGLAGGPGLSDVLAGAASLESTLRAPRGLGSMLVLPASTLPAGNPAALPGRALKQAMTELFAYADVLVFDLAPILPYPDTGMLCGTLDGVALVLRAGQSRRSDSIHAIKALQAEGVTVLGAVLNRERSYIPGFIERML